MTEPTPSASQDRGSMGVLFWMLVNAKTTTELAAEQCGKALRQLEVVRRDYLELGTADLRALLSALDVASDAKRDAAQSCGDCDGWRGGAPCASCESRLAVAAEYGRLAGALRARLPGAAKATPE